MFGKTVVLKVFESSQKIILSSVPLNDSTCPTHPSFTILKLTPLQIFSVSVPIIFVIVGRASVMYTLFSKVIGEISAFCNIAEISNSCIGMFRKVALLEIPKSPLLTAVPCRLTVNSLQRH